MDRKALLLITFFVEGGLFLFGLLLMGGSGALRSRFSFSWSTTIYALLLCLPMIASLYFVVRSRWAPLSHLRDEIEEKVLPIFANCNIVDLALIAFLAGVGEELFFRGWLQALLVERSGVVIGILVTGLVFGILHYLSTAYFVYALITGIYLGIIYFATDNLFIVMAIHTIYDFIALMYLVRMKKKQSHNETIS